MAKLDKDTKDRLIADLSYPYGRVELMCDGFKVALSVERAKKLNYRVMVYVDGCFKGEWLNPTKTFPEQKFYNRTESFLYTPKQRQMMLKDAPVFGRKGSKERTDWEARANVKLTTIDSTFPSGRAAINHLLKVCVSVSVAEDLNP